jgi:excisionase family DNA binding protein
MDPRRRTWLSTEEAASRVGMTGEWVRRQIVVGRLRATAFETGRRRTYRIRSDDWARFLARYSSRTDDPDAP